MKQYILAFCIVALSTSALPAGAGESTEFEFTGAGWGHGVGFSQWGARGQALEDPGKPGEDIAAYYYPGTEPGNMSDLALENDLLTTLENPIWINLATEVTDLEFSPVGGDAVLCLIEHGGTDCMALDDAQPGESWEVRRISPGLCRAFRDGVQVGGDGKCRASVTWDDADRLAVRDLTRAAKICVDGSNDPCEYIYGELKLRDDPSDVGFHVVLAVGLDDYIKGIRELPDDWTSVGVNEAQAIAARSYAAYKFFLWEDANDRTANDPGISDSRKDSCWCHLYDSSVDMQYTGAEKEDDAPHWVTAVENTTDRVITYDGPSWQTYTQEGIVQAFFSASSGGWTNSNNLGFFQEVNGVVTPSNTEWPYLAPVADPWAVDGQWGNPNASWTKTITATEILSELNASGYPNSNWASITGASVVCTAPGATVRFDGTDTEGDPQTVTIAGNWLRSKLGLLSSTVTAIDGQSAAPCESPGPFDDIYGNIHEDSILAIWEAGITLGCDEDSYCPWKVVTRGQMASFISRALDLPAATDDYFSDDNGNVHEDAINALFEAEISFGCDEGLYCPNDPIIREHMAAFLARSLNLTTVSDDYFTDDEDSDFEDEINMVAEAGITLGCEEDLFCPLDPVSRAQMAAFLERAYLPET